MLKAKTASIVLLDALHRCLLFLRDDKPTIPYPDTWDVLGGQVEPGETAEQAIEREMLEELELILKKPTLFKVYDLPDRREHLFWQQTDLDITQTILHEGQKLAWFSENEIRSMGRHDLAFGFRDLLIEFYTERPFDVTGRGS
jgi:8-oxo-dGTP diphosphatase